MSNYDESKPNDAWRTPEDGEQTGAGMEVVDGFIRSWTEHYNAATKKVERHNEVMERYIRKVPYTEEELRNTLSRL